MKKRKVNNSIKITSILIIILLLGAFIINKINPSYISTMGLNKFSLTSIGDTSTRGVKLMDINNNIITFDAGSFKKYVHILLGSSKGENIEDGLKFDIINPKGEVVDSGILYAGKRVTEVYDGMSGEWKIVLHFEDDDASSMIDYGYSITSKREKSWRWLNHPWNITV